MMFIPRFHGFSDVVAWGHHLHLPLRSRNRESRAPRGKKHTANNKNSRRRWHEFRHRDQMRPWRGRTSSQRLPRPLLSRPVSFFVSAGLPQRTSFIARGPKNIDDLGFCVNCTQSLVDHSSPPSCCDCPTNRRQHWITLALACR